MNSPPLPSRKLARISNPFDFIPIELIQFILGQTGEWAGIVERTCKNWFAIIRSQHPDHPPKLFVRCVVQSIPLIKWARQNGYPWSEQTCVFAAKGGHLEVLKYLHESGCPWNADTCTKAAEGGHLNVLKWLRENGCLWNTWTCLGAAKGGHLDVLKYLHENLCPWNSWACGAAALGGHLEVLKYLHENGCPWGDASFRDKTFCPKFGTNCPKLTVLMSRQDPF
jgi:hypothetical protein